MVIDNNGQYPVNSVPLHAANGEARARRGNAMQYPQQASADINASANAGKNANVSAGKNANASARLGNGGASGFAQILDQKTHRKELTISKHAETRLQERNIQLSGIQKDKIADALAKADNKGVKDALVMIDGLAIVANTKSMTIITAVGEGDIRRNIFTNIDGAVFA